MKQIKCNMFITVIMLNFLKMHELNGSETCIKEEPKIKIVFQYKIYNESKTLITKGTATLVFVDMIKNKPIACPQPILEAILKQ